MATLGLEYYFYGGMLKFYGAMTRPDRQICSQLGLFMSRRF